MTIPPGFDKEQIKYNVYAFGCDVRRFTRKRDAARKEHTRAHWQKKVDEYTRYLNHNQEWLAEIEAAEQQESPLRVYAMRLSGACRSGADRAGCVFHALAEGSNGGVALCGKTYGRHSAGWSESLGSKITCPKCLKKIQQTGRRVEILDAPAGK